MRPTLVASALACAVLALAGCGGGDGGEASAMGGRPLEGGTLDYALAADPSQLDPLLATDRASQVVTRQIHEPLVEVLTGPFGDLRDVSGLAKSSDSSRDATIWRFRLRPKIRFGDGTPFNASAVLANADRWLASPEGRVLLPDLAAVDAPRPNLVRFILNRPDETFPERLAQARLGIVSPRGLREASPITGVRVADGGTGTGAFEFREQEPGATTVLARNASWWGTRLRLGPALDQIVFGVAPAWSSASRHSPKDRSRSPTISRRRPRARCAPIRCSPWRAAARRRSSGSSAPSAGSRRRPGCRFSPGSG